MHDYLFTTEVVRFAFMFGVAVSMILYERRHLTTGSIVVPGCTHALGRCVTSSKAIGLRAWFVSRSVRTD